LRRSRRLRAFSLTPDQLVQLELKRLGVRHPEHKHGTGDPLLLRGPNA
jgi:hypothetical protein